MANVISNQVRRAVTLNGTVQFEVTATITNRGDFPDTALFLKEIVDTTSAKTDVFARVVTLADLADPNGVISPVSLAGPKYSSDRNVAVARGDRYYRTNYTVFYFADVNTAVAGESTLKSNLDVLTTDFATYQLQFYSATENTTHPQQDASLWEAATAAYTDAKEAQTTAEEAQDAAYTDYTEAKVTATTTASTVTNKKEWLDHWTEVKNSLVPTDELIDFLNDDAGHAGKFQLDAKSFATSGTNACGYAVSAMGTYNQASDNYYGAVSTFLTAASAFRAASYNYSQALKTIVVDDGEFVPPDVKNDFMVLYNAYMPPGTMAVFDDAINAYVLSARPAYESAKSTFRDAVTPNFTTTVNAFAQAADSFRNAINTLKDDIPPTLDPADVITWYSEAKAEYENALVAQKDAEEDVAKKRTAYEDAKAAATAARLATEAAAAAVHALKPTFDLNTL